MKPRESGPMEPTSLTDRRERTDTRLSTWIAKARSWTDAEYRAQRERAQADRAFADVASAIERGLGSVDARSADAQLLHRLRDAVRGR
jgi:hypothetical protein